MMPIKPLQDPSMGLGLAKQSSSSTTDTPEVRAPSEDISNPSEPALTQERRKFCQMRIEPSLDITVSTFVRPVHRTTYVSPDLQISLALQTVPTAFAPNTNPKLSPEIEEILAPMGYTESIINIAPAKDVKTRHHLLYEMRKEVNRIRKKLGFEPWVEDQSMTKSDSFMESFVGPRREREDKLPVEKLKRLSGPGKSRA